MDRYAFRVVALLLALRSSACGAGDRGDRRGSPDVDAPDTTTRVVAGGVIDSIIPVEEALRRFRADMPEQPTELQNASRSRARLVERFVLALEARDTSALRAMALSRAEFAYLYYPFTQYTHKPYELAPALLWFLMQENSNKGIARALRRYGGKPLGYLDVKCRPEPKREGANMLWDACVLRLRGAAGDTVSRRMFGSIIERDGRYKLVSYATDL